MTTSVVTIIITRYSIKASRIEARPARSSRPTLASIVEASFMGFLAKDCCSAIRLSARTSSYQRTLFRYVRERTHARRPNPGAAAASQLGDDLLIVHDDLRAAHAVIVLASQCREARLDPHRRVDHDAAFQDSAIQFEPRVVDGGNGRRLVAVICYFDLNDLGDRADDLLQIHQDARAAITRGRA